MYCQQCANPLPQEARFCNKCRHSVSGMPVLSPVPVPPEALVLPASILRRLSNFLIDGVASYIPFVLGVVYISYAPLSNELAFIIYYAGLFLSLGYHLLCESIWQRTLGKVITGTKVVDRNGNKPSFLKILGRSLVRFIPFEPFSFLFSGYPVGWHDSLSKTLVVPARLTPEDIRRMDLAQLKRQDSNAARAVIIVIAGLVIIAIIGVLSSVVLVSLNAARMKARDTGRVEIIQDADVSLP